MGVDIIRHKVMLSLDRVPALNEAEDGVAVRVIRVWDTVAKSHSFQGLDMVQAGFPLDEVGIERKSAVIVKARDQMPDLAGVGSPIYDEKSRIGMSSPT
jgi:hypothetical protein